METALQEIFEYWNTQNNPLVILNWIASNEKRLLEKEKEQIMKTFSDGQETPINHPTLPHYSNEEYYNDNYNQNK